jgi:hypothetical protein
MDSNERTFHAQQHYIPALPVLSAKTRHQNDRAGPDRRLTPVRDSGPQRSPLSMTPPHAQHQRNAAGSIEAVWC